MAMSRYIFLLLLLPAMFSCKTNQLFINVVQPAPVTISPEIKKAGIINRSIPTDETKIFDIIDKALTLESADLDRNGAQQSIAGLRDELLVNDRFSEVRVIDDTEFRASRVGLLPPPLSWDIVEMICRESNTDALFALERFDTDTRLDHSGSVMSVKTPLGKLPGLNTAVEILINTGWRIYDPSSKAIIDEFSFTEQLVQSSGINPLATVAALASRRETVAEASVNAGHTYAARLLPWNLSVTRDYFVKGTDNFKLAKRKAQNGKWDEAGELWFAETDNQSRKIAGRAAYNMAIINEINGKLDEALSWAQKAWEDYRIKAGRSYSAILNERKLNEGILKIQELR